ncbi:MAG: hypothetical protein JNM83_28535 [Myxococcales bacterium]|nr:hypothetical protein [Myxococcales bacterium]
MRRTPFAGHAAAEPPSGWTGRDLLKCSLSLGIAGRSYSVAGGQIKALDLDLQSHGFSVEVVFLLVDDSALGGPNVDPLRPAFVGDDLISVVLRVETPLVEENPQRGATPLELHGLVCERALSEHTIEQSPSAARCRRYQIRFVDPAQLLWQQHFPCELYTGKTWQDVIEAHKGTQIQLLYDWTVLTTKRAHVFLGHEPEAQAASFYDFVLWLVDTHGGFFGYDYAQRKYRISGTRPPSGAQTELHPDDLLDLQLQLPVLPRQTVRVLNTYAMQPATTVIPPAVANRSVTGVHADYLIRTPVVAEQDSRVQLERNRLNVAQGPSLAASLRRFPTSPLCPGASVRLTDTARFVAAESVLPPPFAGGLAHVRSFRLSAHAVSQRPDDGFGSDRAAFDLTVSTLLIHDSNQTPPVLKYVPPNYPRLLEGRVVCEIGPKSDETYQIYEDASTSVESYKVAIPLFANQQIVVDFQPTLASGHFYFPAYKDARVLVAVDLQRAWLIRYLDWRPEARLPKESQGNHLLVGKTPQNGTSLRHLYEEDKPVLRLTRTNAIDTQMIEIGEGHLMIEVQEQKQPHSTLVSTIRLDKNAGGSVVIRNDESNITQSIRLNGTSLVLDVEGGQAKSTITQTQTGVTIQCNTFLLDAETITCKSRSTSVHQSQSTMSLTSDSDMRLTSHKNLAAQASSSLTGQAPSIKLSAERDLTATGGGATFQAATATATVQATNVKINGASQIKATGTMISLSAAATLKCETAGMNSIKGGIISVGGGLIKIG